MQTENSVERRIAGAIVKVHHDTLPLPEFPDEGNYTLADALKVGELHELVKSFLNFDMCCSLVCLAGN